MHRLDHPIQSRIRRLRPRRIFGLVAALALAAASCATGLATATLAGVYVASVSRAAPAKDAKQGEPGTGQGEQGGGLGASDALAAITQGELRSFVAKVVQSYTGRAVTIGRMDVDLGWDVLEIRAGDIAFANADWGRAEEMLTVASLKARLDPTALLTGSIVLPLIDVDGAKMIYAVSESGETNLPLPKSKSKEKKPFSLADLPLLREATFTNTTAVYRNYQTGAETELDLAKASFAAPEDGSITLAVDGTYDGQALKLDASGGSWEALTASAGEAFPVDLQASLGALTASAAGSIAQPAKLQGVDLKVDLSAKEIPAVYPLGKTFVQPTPALHMAGHLTSETRDQVTRWTLADLDASLDKSEITGGKLTVSLAGPRPRVEGHVRASQFWFDDLTSYFSSPEPKAKEEGAGVLPTSSFWPLPAFRAADANIDFELAQFRGFGLYFDMLFGTATTNDGTFQFTPIRGTRGEAEMTTYVSVYSNASPVKTDVKAEVSRLNLDRRVDLPVANVPVTGRLSGRVNLGMKGNTIADMAGTANGNIVFAIDKGQVSGLLLELLGLDIAESLALVVTEGDEDTPVPIRCALGNLPVKDGVVNLKTFVIDTADTVIKADGTVGLGAETLDLEVVPYPKDFSLLSLRSPIGIQGTFADPEIFTDPVGIGVESTADKVINAILTPIAGLLPPFDSGLDDDSDCRKLLQEAGVSPG